jgi:hypothetical protein
MPRLPAFPLDLPRQTHGFAGRQGPCVEGPVAQRRPKTSAISASSAARTAMSRALAVEDRHDDLRARRARAGDVAREGLDVRHDLGPLLARRRAADAALERDDEAAVAALVGADLEESGLDHAVEADPVVPRSPWKSSQATVAISATASVSPSVSARMRAAILVGMAHGSGPLHAARTCRGYGRPFDNRGAQKRPRIARG